MGQDIPKGKYKYLNYWYFVYDKFTDPLNIQPIYLGLFANIGMVLLFFLKKNKQAKFYYFQLVTLALLILFTASRWQILIGVFNYFIFLIYFEDLKPQKKILGFVSVIVFILIFSWMNPVTKTRLIEAISYKEAFYKDDFGGTSIRLKKWESAVKCIAKNPFGGYGVGDGKAKLMDQYKKDKFYLGFYNKFNAHNQYLDTLIYVGLLGFIVLCSVFYYAYKYSINKLYLFLITNVFLLSFFTESILNRQWGVISFPFFMIIFSIFDYERIEN